MNEGVGNGKVIDMLRMNKEIMNDKCNVDKLLYEYRAPHAASIERKILGCPEGNLKCQMCGEMKASHNRQRTAYHDSDNMADLCPGCQKEADDHWDEMWDEYYHGCM